jgi:hypothetical protein
MFTYEQSTGLLLDPGSKLLGHGYAGHGAGINNPQLESVQSTGPLPRGRYVIGAPYHNPKTGRVTMNLDPEPANEMFGRSAFRLHGDNALMNRSASEGCIVMPLGVRLAVAQAIGFHVDPHDYTITPVPASTDNVLQVVA